MTSISPNSFDWSAKSILVTGGTGSFGRRFVATMLEKYHPRRLVIFSRDELKQHEMRQLFPDTGDSPIRYFIGDVRDRERLNRAFYGIDVVVHAAALKHVAACEYNPFEAIQTNVAGAKNIIEAAIDEGVGRVLAMSTDKAVNPANLYGATKLCAEKLFVQGNAYSLPHGTSMSCVRYGNVVGSRGSVVPLFHEQKKQGRFTITDPLMTRFWITLDQGVSFVIQSIERMHGGEIFIPKLPSMRITDLAAVMGPTCKQEMIGIRPGEKLHEAMISPDESAHTLEFDDYFVVQPAHPWWNIDNWEGGKRLEYGFAYSSDTNSHWLTPDELRPMVTEVR